MWVPLLLFVLGTFVLGTNAYGLAVIGKRHPRIHLLSAVVEEGNGKFVRLEESNSLSSTTPLAVIVCNSCGLLSNSHLETLDDVVFAATSATPPVVILGEIDRTQTLQNLLNAKILETRDHVLPTRDFCKTGPCVILFSGFPREAVSSIVRGLRTWDSPGASGRFPAQLAFAVVVQNALDKKLGVLVQEIQGDHAENTAAAAAASAGNPSEA